MKTLIQNGLPLIVALLALSATCKAQTASPACNNWLIAGVYGFTVEGTKLGGAGPVGPQVGVAMTDFDGKGSLVQIDAVAINGVQTANFNETPTKGTYTVNADCTGTFTLNFTDGRPTVTTYFVVVDNGNEIDTMVKGIPPPAAQGFIATRSIGKRRFSKSPDNDRSDSDR
jgi:hypothetical protein